MHRRRPFDEEGKGWFIEPDGVRDDRRVYVRDAANPIWMPKGEGPAAITGTWIFLCGRWDRNLQT